jgi:hypothetical protein
MQAIVISLSHFHHNAAGDGGAISATGCSDMRISGCWMTSNTATSSMGGAVQSIDSSMIVTNASFLVNNASDSGGGVFSLGGSLSVSFSLFEGNDARRGSGSAIWLASQVTDTDMETDIETYRVRVVQNCSFSNNSALNGGGTVYWDLPDEDEPLDLLPNTFLDNTALYGNDVATGVRLLSLGEQTGLNITQYSSFAPPISVSALDFYHQIVKTQSTSYAVASLLYTAMCYQTYGSVTGGTVQEMAQGISNFTSLLVYCDPGYSMTINITYTVEGNSLSALVPMTFRVCEKGEYYGNHICSPCEKGTFSLTEPSSVSLSDLTQIKVCKKCPDEADDCYSDVMVVKEGYWRVSDEASTILKCPLGSGSCGGGAETGDASCEEGYHGLM